MKLNLGIIIITILLASCDKIKADPLLSTDALSAEKPEAFKCINDNVDKPLLVKDVKTKIEGSWQLKGLISMLPTQTVDNLKLIFKPKTSTAAEEFQVELYVKGVFVETQTIKFKQISQDNYKGVDIDNPKVKLNNGDFNFIYGNIVICDEELRIDNGIAFDANGYLFRKVK